MRRRDFLKASGAVATTGLIAGCTGLGGGGGGGGSGPITIGAIEPQSGPFQPWSTAHIPGLEFGVEQVNADGGVLGGRELELVIEDTGGDPAEADSLFRRVVEQEGAVAATGPVNSDVGIRTAQTAEELEVPLYLHMSGSNAVIKSNTTHTYRVGLLPATNIMKSQAQLVEDRDIQNVAAVIGDFAWGRSIESAIQDNFPVDVNIQVAPVTANDFKSQLRQVDSELDMFIATGHPPGQITITQQLFELGISADLITGSGFPLSILAGALGQRATQGVVMYHLNDTSTQAFREVAQSYAESDVGDGRYMDPNTSYGYVTAQLIAEAIETAGEATPAAINEAMTDIQLETVYSEPIQYRNNGELHNQINNFSRIELAAPDYASNANAQLNQFFSSEQIGAIPADLN